MMINGGYGSHGLLPAMRRGPLPAFAGNGGSSSMQPARYAAAFAVIGLGVKGAEKQSAVLGAIGLRHSGASLLEFARLASFYKAAYAEAVDAHPGISSRNAKHIAQYDTIMANREMFPLGAFKLRTELGDGASIETEIPPLGATSLTVSLSISVSAITIATATGQTQLSVTTASAQVSYKEWG